jgi:fatty-acyl-CoA synthase
MTIQHFDWIAHHASKHGDNLAMIDPHTNRAFSYAQFHDRVGRLASALRRQHGVARGDRVAVLAHNSSDLCEIQFACARLGAIFVPMNWRLTVPELSYIVGDCAPVLLIHDPEFAGAAAQLAAACDVPRLCGRDPDASEYERLIEASTNDVEAESLTLDDTATILYTSGTTGHPKGAIITHGMRFWQTVNLTGPERLTADSVCLVTLPQFHVGGLDVYANPVFHYGGKVVVMRGYDPAATLRLLTDRQVGITHFVGAPAHFLFMEQLPEFETGEFAGLHRRFARSAAATAQMGSARPAAAARLWHDRDLRRGDDDGSGRSRDEGGLGGQALSTRRGQGGARRRRHRRTWRNG